MVSPGYDLPRPLDIVGTAELAGCGGSAGPRSVASEAQSRGRAGALGGYLSTGRVTRAPPGRSIHWIELRAGPLAVSWLGLMCVMAAYRLAALNALVAVFVVCGCASVDAQETPHPPPRAPSLAVADSALVTEGQVTRAVAGDSLDAHVRGNRTLVGYLGAETPPTNQPCGQEARARNRELAGGRVFLEEDAGYTFDEGGRRLFYAYTEDGVSIDEVLVREGLARAVRTNARYGAYLAALQAEAEADGRGCLWSGTRSPWRSRDPVVHSNESFSGGLAPQRR